MSLAPLRLSIEIGHPYFAAEAFTLGIGVALNGVTQKEVVTYDRKEGWLERFKRDSAGKLVIDCDEIAIERVHGVVSAWIED